MPSLSSEKNLKVLSFGCGPCTDLFAIDYLRVSGKLCYQILDYRGVDYSRDVWNFIHNDIKSFDNNQIRISFHYRDMCEVIDNISQGRWRPNLIVFQYVFSDMNKHTDHCRIEEFIDKFSSYYNEKCEAGTYIIINDINLNNSRGGGRDYFEKLHQKLVGVHCVRGHFLKESAYPYGIEFKENKNLFDLSPLKDYNPFNTCASAQMLIRKD